MMHAPFLLTIVSNISPGHYSRSKRNRRQWLRKIWGLTWCIMAYVKMVTAGI